MPHILVIPARMGSTRLPNKPMALIHGKPMIVHAWEQAVASKAGRVVVACDHDEVYQAIKNIGGEAVMTSPDLPSGSDRVAAVLDLIDPGEVFQTVVCLQGDVPFYSPGIIERLVKPFEDACIDIATLGANVTDKEFLDNPNNVKIVMADAQQGCAKQALYFSRSNVPYGAKFGVYHIGMYAYRRHALKRFVRLPMSPLEKTERLEQLRALENGMKIGVEVIDEHPVGIDTLEDLQKINL